MVSKRKQSEEYQKYLWVRHWQPIKKVAKASAFVNPDDPLYPLFLYLYTKTQELYTELPNRKNGELSFIHPLNVVGVLSGSYVENVETFCAGILHDYVEEKVDLYKKQKRIREHAEGIKILDSYEEEVFLQLHGDIESFCSENGIDQAHAHTIISVTRLLTRHKRDFYYRSICHIFNCQDKTVKEMAVRVKLADRTHNILSIESFTEQERIYQCFKNLFILNNTKRYLIETLGDDIGKHSHHPTVVLFKRCGKATFDAFQTILEMTARKGASQVKTMLQLGFKKYALEHEAVREVTQLNRKETHPIRLYQGVIRKYDARLHHKWDLFDEMRNEEIEYVKNFFADYKFTKDQLHAVLDYKDAYSLKEVVAYIMYVPDYFIAGFEFSALFCGD